MAYIEKEGHLANVELREVKQYCQNGTPNFLRKTVILCTNITEQPLLVRLDTGNDATENVGILLEDGTYYVIKCNLSMESKDEWMERIKSWCKDNDSP